MLVIYLTTLMSGHITSNSRKLMNNDLYVKPSVSAFASSDWGKDTEKFSLDNGCWSIAILFDRLLNCFFISVLNTVSLTVYPVVCTLSARWISCARCEGRKKTPCMRPALFWDYAQRTVLMAYVTWNPSRAHMSYTLRWSLKSRHRMWCIQFAFPTIKF